LVFGVLDCPSCWKKEGKTKNSAHSFTKSTPGGEAQIPVAELPRHVQDWLLDGEIRGFSPHTTEARRIYVGKFLEFLQQREHETCGVSELREFFYHLNRAHQEPGGRWGNPQLTRPLRPSTVGTYHKHIRTLFNWMVREEVIAQSPMERVPVPVVRADQIQPFTQDQVAALLRAAEHSRHRRRDVALVLMMFDTGLRASEVCGLKLKDVDLQSRRCSVLGKGNKVRTVPFGKDTMKALWQYLREDKRDEHREPDDPLFLSDSGTRAAEAMTRNGLFQLVQRLGVAAGLKGVRCSPHTFRHSFAVTFLRNGGNTFSLKEMLGHSALHMTNKYVALAQADIENQHRQFSPADSLKRRGR